MHPDNFERRNDQAGLLRRIVGQFVEREMHPIADIKQFEQLALGLIDMVDAPSVARIMRLLCVHPETPQAVFDRLLAKGGPCAELALQFAPRLPPDELAAAARSGDPAIARAVARRNDLDGATVAALAQRGEPRTMRALVENRTAHFDDQARRALIETARDDVGFGRMLLDRPDFGAEDEALFLSALRHERGNMILNAVRRTLAASRAPGRPADPALAERLEVAALRNDREGTASLFGEAFGCSQARARLILDDPGGEPLALALAALGLDPDAATRIFLCGEAAIAHDTATVRGLIELMRVTPQRAAAQIMAAVTGGAIGERAQSGDGGPALRRMDEVV
jgi:uncharacterized protein (DUF2336 family)